MATGLSVLILAKNEEKNIADCIKSVSFADEIIVIDDYSSDNTLVKEVLIEILKSDPRILNSGTPGVADPFVALNALKDSSVEYIMKAWVRVEDYWSVMYDINEAIFTTLHKHDISFPFPQMDVHVKNS